jgi:hypothetical protein
MRPAVWSLALETNPRRHGTRSRRQQAPRPPPGRRDLRAAGRRLERRGIAQDWQISTARLRALLFAEGESLRSLVREQRVAWVLARWRGWKMPAPMPARPGLPRWRPCSALART